MMSFKMWLFYCLCSFSSHYVRVPIYIRALLRYTCTYANVALYVTINRKLQGKCQGLSKPDRFIIDILLLVYNKNVGESGYSISSKSESSGYSTSMLTEGTQVNNLHNFSVTYLL